MTHPAARTEHRTTSSPTVVLGHREPLWRRPPFRPMAGRPDPVVERTAVGAGDVAQFTEIVRYRTDDAIERFIEGVLAKGNRAETVFLDLLTPTAQRFGEMWVEDRCSFAEVTIAVGRLQQVVRRLSHTLLHERQPSRDRSVLLACMPGAQHTLGLFVVAELLLTQGFEVTIGAPLSEGTPSEAVRHRHFDAVGLSLSCDADSAEAKAEIARLRRVSNNPDLRVVVGGCAVSRDQRQFCNLGADGYAPDARAGITVLERIWAD